MLADIGLIGGIYTLMLRWVVGAALVLVACVGEDKQDLTLAQWALEVCDSIETVGASQLDFRAYEGYSDPADATRAFLRDVRRMVSTYETEATHLETFTSPRAAREVHSAMKTMFSGVSVAATSMADTIEEAQELTEIDAAVVEYEIELERLFREFAALDADPDVEVSLRAAGCNP